MLREYVRNGRILVATLFTSAADEFGRMRKGFGLADVFGASFTQPEPVDIPDLYLKLASGGELIPQDPRVLRFKVNDGTVLAETIDRGHRRNLGPAIVKRQFGAGNAL
ncbi:MAG TPA: hypothetical protein VFC21_03585 [Bryobacteraceae bacterium]|nr:hypothetical protein [Bryobacteraceae bacterium]